MKRLDAPALLRRAGLRAKKSFGQSFLVSEHVVAAIASACVPANEVGRARVLEIGAGLGALTAALAARASRVIAVERDRDLVPLLCEELAPEIARGIVEVLEADAQSLDFGQLLAGPPAPRVVAGNLPYQVTGRLIEQAVTSAGSFDRAVFMVQKEVAERLVAPPGTKEYGALTVFTRAAFDVSRLLTVSPGNFYPRPEVTSAVVELTPHPRARETDGFRALVRAAFAMRRKKLRNAWQPVVPDPGTLARLAAASAISLDARGETLDVADFARAADALEAVSRLRTAGQEPTER